MFFAKSMFRTKMVILAGLEAILEPLGTILEPLGAVLGFLGDFWRPPGGVFNFYVGASRAFQDPPLPKLLAKANSD